MFRPGDWYCPNCNFLIFSNKKQCVKCKCNKPEPKVSPVNELYLKLTQETYSIITQENDKIKN